MTNILLILICVLPFSSLFIHVKDIWHSQGAFFQLGILTAFAWSLYKIQTKHNRLHIKNLPVALLTFWLGLMTIIYWNMGIVKDGLYNFHLFMPFFNYLCVVLFYKLVTDYLESDDIKKITRYFSISVIILTAYCMLQVFNLDQFFKTIDPGVYNKDLLVGTIGNSSHLASYLSMCLPFLYYHKSNLSNLGILLIWTCIILTGSAVGLATAVIVSVFYNLFFRIRTKYDWVIGLFIAGFLLLIAFDKGLFYYIDSSGRFEKWAEYFPLFQNNAITGAGLGRIFQNVAGKASTVTWRHVHNEFFQIAIEGGVVALFIVLYGIKEYFKKFWRLKNNELAVCMGSVFLAFVLNSIFNFTAHLWLTSTLGMFSYAGLFCIEEGI